MTLEKSLQTNRILVIDDDDTVLNSIKKQLFKQKMMNSEFTNNPLTGLDLVEQNQYDIVLCDIKMKPITGLEVLKRIRLKKPDLPVIIITGFVDDKIMMDAKELGCNEFLIKPVRRTVLIETISKVLNL